MIRSLIEVRVESTYDNCFLNSPLYLVQVLGNAYRLVCPGLMESGPQFVIVPNGWDGSPIKVYLARPGFSSEGWTCAWDYQKPEDPEPNERGYCVLEDGQTEYLPSEGRDYMIISSAANWKMTYQPAA